MSCKIIQYFNNRTELDEHPVHPLKLIRPDGLILFEDYRKGENGAREIEKIFVVAAQNAPRFPL